mmetsp:Transcript_32628/g.80419  ORF Transcript_32628/g.80419 Transcript_32628/m.80419 type:complete len:225 (-) Transcript_32628:804-1478(-)
MSPFAQLLLLLGRRHNTGCSRGVWMTTAVGAPRVRRVLTPPANVLGAVVEAEAAAASAAAKISRTWGVFRRARARMLSAQSLIYARGTHPVGVACGRLDVDGVQMPNTPVCVCQPPGPRRLVVPQPGFVMRGRRNQMLTALSPAQCTTGQRSPHVRRARSMPGVGIVSPRLAQGHAQLARCMGPLAGSALVPMPSGCSVQIQHVQLPVLIQLSLPFQLSRTAWK